MEETKDAVAVTPTIQAGSGADSPNNPSDAEFAKLFRITEKIMKGIAKADPPNKPFRFFKIAYEAQGYPAVVDDVKRLRNELQIQWMIEGNLDKLLRENRLELVYPAQRSRAKLDLQKIYLEAVKKSTSLEASSNEEMKYYHEIFRLHLARILNFCDEEDPKLTQEIKELEGKLRSDNVPQPALANTTFSTPFGNINPADMMDQIPPQYRDLAKNLMAKGPDLMKMGSKLADPSIMAAIGRGDLKGVAKRMIKDQDVKKQMASLGGTINPLLKQTAQFFQNSKMPMPAEARMPDGEDITIEMMLQKVEEQLDLEGDDSVEAAEKVTDDLLEELEEASAEGSSSKD
jgi:hypothetical protein